MLRSGLLALLVWPCIAGLVHAEEASRVPGRTNYDGHIGATLHVSKLGDNSDGSSWQKAFHTIQAALSAVPDKLGGHRVLVRPDHYFEPNLEVPHPGAAGSYNQLIGDIDGKLGSGATGWVVIDAGDPETGFKSWDWWTNIRASSKEWPVGNNATSFSSIAWDRWAVQNLYATGSDAGLFWDLTHGSGAEFTIQVEDCVGIGRAFGGGVCYPIVRKDEPSLFRRCHFMALDWGGDTGAVLIGGSEATMPEIPHVVFDDCTLVHPDNAVQVSFASKHVRAKFTNCRMIVLNFSQPQITPSTGIICSEKQPSLLHVDLADCMLAGYQVFGTGGKPEKISYTTTGRNVAYLQFQQAEPEGFERINAWPMSLFSCMAPPQVKDGAIQWPEISAPAKQASPVTSK